MVAKIILRKSSAIKYSCCLYAAAAGANAAILSHSTTAKAEALIETTTTTQLTKRHFRKTRGWHILLYITLPPLHSTMHAWVLASLLSLLLYFCGYRTRMSLQPHCLRISFATQTHTHTHTHCRSLTVGCWREM